MGKTVLSLLALAAVAGRRPAGRGGRNVADRQEDRELHGPRLSRQGRPRWPISPTARWSSSPSWAPNARWPSSMARGWPSWPPSTRTRAWPSSASTRISRTRSPSWPTTPSEHKIEFPLLKDAGNVIADQFGAVRTPEVFVLDADRVVRYWGRIDDQYGFQDKGVAYPARRAQAPRPGRRHRRSCWPASRSASRRSPARAATSAACKQPDADSDVTYTKHIAAIFNNNCVYCHRDGPDRARSR